MRARVVVLRLQDRRQRRVGAGGRHISMWGACYAMHAAAASTPQGRSSQQLHRISALHLGSRVDQGLNILMHMSETYVPAGGRDLAYISPARQRFANIASLVLPATMAGVLAWGFMAPDDQPFGSAGSPHQVSSDASTLVPSLTKV